MGIIIAPFLLIAITMVIISVALTIVAIIKKQTDFRMLFLGIPIAGVILATIIFSYSQKSEAYALGPFFIFPFFMICVPFSFGMIFKIINTKLKNEIQIDKILLSSVVFSTILFFAFYSYTFNIIDTFGIQKIH